MHTLKRSLTLTFAALLLAAPLTACKEDPPVSSAAPSEKAAATQRVAAAPRPAPAPMRCDNCGTIVGIEEMKQKGKGSGMGIVAGAVIGAVIGHQVGGGRGKDAATAAGAIGGGYAGNEIEKNAKATTYYRVTVSMETGGTRVVDVGALNGLSSGSKVKVVGNNLEMARG